MIASISSLVSSRGVSECGGHSAATADAESGCFPRRIVVVDFLPAWNNCTIAFVLFIFIAEASFCNCGRELSGPPSNPFPLH